MSNKQLHIFFIASWLPSLHDAFEGDFILRHAQSVALMHKVTLVYAIETEVIGNENLKQEIVIEGNLTVFRIYLNKRYKAFYLKNKYYAVIDNLFKSEHTKNNIQIIHANVHWRAGYCAYLLHKKYKIPFVISEHSTYFNTNYYTRLSVASYSFLKKYLVKLSLHQAAMVMPVSNYLAYWIKKFAPKTKCYAVSNVVDEQLFYYTPALPTNPFIFMHASMGWSFKNIDIIMNAVRILSMQQLQFELHLYTPITEEIKHYIQANQLHAYIKPKGNISHDEMPAAIQKSHATILYSSMETQGCILIESLCCGRPIITGSAPVFAETLTTKNGYGDSYNSVENLMQLMLRMMQNYTDFNQEQISKDACAKYGKYAIANEFDNVYRKVIK